jgi:20S proteasome alpha/beta subunit
MFIDDHIGVSIAGLASDARILWYKNKIIHSKKI